MVHIRYTPLDHLWIIRYIASSKNQHHHQNRIYLWIPLDTLHHPSTPPQNRIYLWILIDTLHHPSAPPPDQSMDPPIPQAPPPEPDTFMGPPHPRHHQGRIYLWISLMHCHPSTTTKASVGARYQDSCSSLQKVYP